MKWLAFLLCLLAATAAAQQRPIFDPDDFIDPRQTDGSIFISRLVLGAGRGLADDYRPLGQDVGFVHITNSFYFRNLQFDYKRSEVRGEDDSGSASVQQCCRPPIYFPTPPPRDATPAAPLPGSKDTLQIGWYQPMGGGGAQLPVMLRYRFSWSRQPIETEITNAANGTRSSLSGDEQSFGLDADTWFRIRGRDLFGAFRIARNVRSGTIDERAQTEVTYTSRFPAVPVGKVLLRADLTVGGVSGRGANGLNVINPAFEAYWYHDVSRAHVHLVWSPQATRSGLGGWQTRHQVAVFVDRALYVKLFGR